MSKFKDKTGHEWSIDLNVGLIEDIKEATGVDFDLLLNDSEKLATMLFTEPKKLVEVLYVCCADQIHELNITPKEFGYRFDRGAIDKGANALIESLITFYPRASAGRVLAEEMPGLIEKIDQKIAEKMKDHVSKAYSNIAMN